MQRNLRGLCIHVVLALLVGSIGQMPGKAQASVIAADSIGYTATASLNGQNGGYGWAGPYSPGGDTSALVSSGSLSYGALKTAGNAIQTAEASAGLTENVRTLSTTVGADGTTAYMSFMINPTEPVNNGSLGSYAGITLGSLLIGKLSDGFYGIQTLGQSDLSPSTVAPVQGVTALMVVRVTFQPGADKIELFVNPTPGQPLPSTPDVTRTDIDLGQTNLVILLADHAVAFDEIRLGTALNDVAPVNPVSSLVFQSQSTGQIGYWTMSGPAVVGSVLSGSMPAPGWSVVGSGDFNGDGQPDLVFQNQTTGQIAIWLMDGPYYIGGNALTPVPAAGFNVVAVADMNGDGNPDLILQNQSTGQIVLWFLNGTDFAGGVLLSQTASSNFKVVGAGDFDGNASPDLLFQDQNSGQIVVWYMNGPTYIGQATLGVLPEAGWVVRGVADYNNDGQPDLVFQNVTTNQIVFWYLQDFTYIGGDVIEPVPYSDYLIAASL